MGKEGKTNVQGYVDESVADAVRVAAKDQGIRVSSFVARAVIDRLVVEGYMTSEDLELNGRAKFEALVEQAIESGFSWDQAIEHFKKLFEREVA